MFEMGKDDPEKQANGPRYRWWLEIAVLTVLVLSAQSVATMLGRLYFNKGGNNNWMVALVQTAGFPVTLFFLFIFSKTTTATTTSKATTTTTTTAIDDGRKGGWMRIGGLYLVLGTLLAADSMLYTIGMKYLPVSTFSLICASQLAFNALFSYFLNAQKMTPYITNSLVLLTMSSVLLVFQTDSQQTANTSKPKYFIGFLCTLVASAGYGLMLSITQLAFRKILKSESYKVVLDLIVYQYMIATVGIMVGLFASGEWNNIKGEMDGYKSGKLSYIMTLVWTAISWQVFSLGCVGLIFKASSLFSNVISTLGLPIVPVLAFVFFHEKMNGVKVIAMLLAIWGFTSYIYQHYLDDLKLKGVTTNVTHEVDLIETRSTQ